MPNDFQIQDNMLTLRLELKPVHFNIDGKNVLMHELGIRLPFTFKPLNLDDSGCGVAAKGIGVQDRGIERGAVRRLRLEHE